MTDYWKLMNEDVISFAEYQVIHSAEKIGFVSRIDEIRYDNGRREIEIILTRKKQIA